MSSSDGDPPPGGKPPGRPNPPSTLIGFPQTTTPPAPAPEAAPPPPPAPVAARPSAPKRSTLPPPIRGAHPTNPPYAIPPASNPAITPPPSGPHAAIPQPLAPQPTSGPSGIPQPSSQPNTAPYGGPATQPHAGPFAQPASGPTYPPPPPPPADLPYAQVLHSGGAYEPPPGSSFDSIEQPGSKFVAFLKISSRRAFRLRIEPNEVLPSERRALESATPPITDRNLQAFLAWRRSVLFLVACALIPLSVIGAIDALQSRKFTPIFFVRGAPALAEGIFAWICWHQLKQWAHWRSQRRKLFYGWLLFMLTPFIVFIYPLRTIFEELAGSSREKLLALGVEGVYRQAVMPFVFAMLAMLQLAPKAISLMPGLIRASLVIKLLFPGSAAPGWLMVFCAPLYALLAYVILIIPYQFTGSGWFIAGVLGIIIGQAVLAHAGFALAKPLEELEAMKQIKRVRRYYISVMVISALLIIVALGSLVAQLNLRATDVITAVLKFETNVLILTMIGADLVVTNLDRARNYTAGRGHVEEQTEVKIAAFVSLETPPPPPPGPAA